MEALGDLGRTLVAYNPLHPEEDGGKGQLRVVSYNVYADIRCDTPEVAHTSSKSWKVRCTRLLAEVLSYRADVVLLQDADHFKDFWQPKLAESGNTLTVQHSHYPTAPLLLVLTPSSHQATTLSSSSALRPRGDTPRESSWPSTGTTCSSSSPCPWS